MLTASVSQYLLLISIVFTGAVDAVIRYLNIVIRFAIWAVGKPFGCW